MVSVNCAAIPGQLAESTLFGHEKGAFTGANQRHTLQVPPLRERQEDIDLLAQRFLKLANKSNERCVGLIESDALAALCAYDWPGNIRELRNAIERAVVIAQHDVITVADLPPAVRAVLGTSEELRPEPTPVARDATPMGVLLA